MEILKFIFNNWTEIAATLAAIGHIFPKKTAAHKAADVIATTAKQRGALNE